MAENTSFKSSELFKSLGKGDFDEVMKAYDAAPTTPTDERLNLIHTVHRDTILHVAIYMGKQEIAIAIIGRCKDDDSDELLTKANDFGNTALHEAAATEYSCLVEELLKKAPKLLSSANNRGEMPLYTAAYYGHDKIYNLLYERVENNHPGDLPKHLCSHQSHDGKDVVRSTVLHATVHAEFYELAYEIATRESSKNLVMMQDKDSKTCLHLLASNPTAFKSGNKWGPIKRFLYYCVPPSENNVVPDRNDSKSGDVTGASSNHEARSGFKQVISSANRFVWKSLRGWRTMKSIYDLKKKHGLALKLAKLLIKADYSWDSSRSRCTGDPFGGASSTTTTATPSAADHTPIPLFIATSHGILEIVNETLEVYAQALEYRDELRRQNILHAAIMHRQMQIFDIVKNNEAPHSRLVRQINNNGYTILHQVGNMDFYNGDTQPGPALQLQEELEWFEKVKELVPQHYAMIRSSRNEEIETPQQNAKTATDVKTKVPKRETAREYFCRTHGQLLKDAQDWLKTTSQSCSTVAGLMATVAFAAAFTVPGGNDDNNGQPILIHSPFFLVFVITDALSLASSLTSLVMFLSILTSPFELDDFRVSLPRKLILGFTFLFFSVAVSMLAFASTLMLTMPIKKRLTTTFVYCVAFLPVTMFALLQWPLYRAFGNSVKYSIAAIRSILPRHLISSAYKKVTNKDHTS